MLPCVGMWKLEDLPLPLLDKETEATITALGHKVPSTNHLSHIKPCNQVEQSGHGLTDADLDHLQVANISSTNPSDDGLFH